MVALKPYGGGYRPVAGSHTPNQGGGGDGNNGGGNDIPATPNNSASMFMIDPVLMQFLAKYGINPGTTQLPYGRNIFDLPTASFTPGNATQRGIFS